MQYSLDSTSKYVCPLPLGKAKDTKQTFWDYETFNAPTSSWAGYSPGAIDQHWSVSADNTPSVLADALIVELTNSIAVTG